MYKCVLFDLDGTLVDSVESMAQAGNRMLASMGLPPQPVNQYKYYAGDGADILVRRALQDAGDKECIRFEEAFQKYKVFFAEDCTYHVKPYDGIISLLDKLKENHIKIGVISNKPHLRTVDVINDVFGQNVFDIVVGHKDGIPKKPDPTSTLDTAKKLDVRPADCIYVGDTNVDMKTGSGAGMFTIGVLWGFRDKEELARFNPQAIVETPAEIVHYLI